MKLSPQMSAELRKEVKAFNRKRKRLLEKGVIKSLLPEKASVRALKNAYRDSESLQARLDQMAKLSSRGKIIENKKGVKGTENLFAYRKAEAQQMVKIYEQELQSTKAMKTKYKSGKSSHMRTLRAKIKYLSKDPENMDARALYQQASNTLTPEKLYGKNLIYRENYINKLYEYASIGDIDEEYVDKLVKKLDRVPLEDFYNITKANPELSDVLEFMVESPPSRKGIKSARPRYDSKDMGNKFIDLYNSIDNILANSNIDYI